MIVTATDSKGVNTSTSVNSNTQTITVSKGVKLLDTSYSGTALTETAPFWTDVENGEHKYKAVSQQYDANSNFYYGVSWKLTFSIDVTNSKSNYDIFFNVKGSSATDKTSGATKTAFRVFRQSSTNSSIAWAPFGSTTEVNGTVEKPLGFVSGVDRTTQYTSASANTMA